MRVTECVKEPCNDVLVHAKGVGLRERSRLQRQDRIRIAARKLFAERGYDATTIREIAAPAAMDKSTLFRYITEKRDLIHLTSNQELRKLNDVCLAAPRPWQTFSEKILSMIEPRYRLFSSEPNLARIFLSETLHPMPGSYLAANLEMRDRFVQGIREVVAQAKQTGELAATEDAELIARLIFLSYAGAVRWWLFASENPDWRSGMRDFTLALTKLVSGLDVRAEKSEGSQRSTPQASTKRRRQTPAVLARSESHEKTVRLLETIC